MFDNDYSNMTGLFEVAGGGSFRVNEFRRVGFPSFIRESRFRWFGTNATFEEIVELAYPDGLADENNIFRVEFENAQSQPHEGSLVKGGHTQVRRSGTDVSVFRSVRS